jgi:hypothetical protein
MENSLQNHPALLDNDSSIDRRKFIKGTGAAAAAVMTASAFPIDPFLEKKESFTRKTGIPYDPLERMHESFEYRLKTAISEKINVGVQADNGDLTRFTDFSGNYSKALQHDALGINSYTGTDADELDINGELSKLAFNVTSGHGIHAGIHFRSSSHWAVLLGEQVALSVLRDRAKSYSEPFSIAITKFDGTTAIISNIRNHCDYY